MTPAKTAIFRGSGQPIEAVDMTDSSACSICGEGTVPGTPLCLPHLRVVVRLKVGADPVAHPRQPQPTHDPVVYYLRFGDRVKIGTTTNLRVRLADLPHDELLATEPGSFDVEKQRHRQFAAYRVNGEWFHHCPAIAEHIATLT